MKFNEIQWNSYLLKKIKNRESHLKFVWLIVISNNNNNNSNNNYIK